MQNGPWAIFLKKFEKNLSKNAKNLGVEIVFLNLFSTKIWGYFKKKVHESLVPAGRASM